MRCLVNPFQKRNRAWEKHSVLRTGFISTLHPWKGTAEELWFLAANFINLGDLSKPRSLQGTG
jgi:hypothetical protein